MRRLAMKGFVALVPFALAVGLCPRAHAQEGGDSRSLLEMPRARQGYWLALGINGVAANLIEEGHNRGVYTGWGFSIRLGQLITERLGIGLLYEDAGYLIGRIGKRNDKGGAGGLVLEGHASLWRNLSVHGGFGVGYVFVKDNTALDTSLRGGGGSYMALGVMYDFFPWRKRLTGGWAITPTLDFRAMPDGNVNAYSLIAGLQVIRWSGLPDNMIVLPEE